MSEGQTLQHHMLESQGTDSPNDATTAVVDQSPLLGFRGWKWWLLVAFNIAFLLIGQAVAVFLGKFYYDEGGNSKWMATLVQTAGFPILLPLLLFPSSSNSPTTNNTISTMTSKPSIATLVLIYISLGVLLAGDNMLYSIGLLYLPASTYFLICATQLGFNAIFSYFINSEKITVLILNSVVLLTFSASLIAIRAESTEPAGVSRGKFMVGFICTLLASAAYSLLLSLMQLSFQKVSRRETFSVVLEMQICTSLIATSVCILGLFASGEWKSLSEEMDGFRRGRVSYVMVLFWTAVAWQICSVGIVGLIYVVSSLFSNVISTLALPLVPVASVVLFHEKMDGIKVVAMLLATWGFASYIYQHYLDDSKLKATTTTTCINEVPKDSTS